MQALLENALIESDPNKRIKKYHQLQTIIEQQHPYYSIAHLIKINAVNKKTVNIYP